MKKFLNKEISSLKLWWLLIPMGVGLIFLIIGSIFDLQISNTIVNQHSGFGIFFEGWGMAIPFAIGSIAGAAVAGGLWHFEKKIWKVVGIAAFIIAIGVMTYETGHHIMKYFAGGAWMRNMGFGGKVIGYGISLILMCAAGIPSFFVFKKCENPEQAIRVGLFVMLWMAIEVGLLELIKAACYRPRWRYLFGYMYDANGNAVYHGGDVSEYRAWFANWQWFSKSAYADLVDNDSIKSFPSGHTGFANVLLALPAFLPLYGLKEDKLKKWAPATFALCACYLFVLAFARVEVGAHWTSDVSFAMMLVSCLGIALLLINDKIKIKKKEAQ